MRMRRRDGIDDDETGGPGESERREERREWADDQPNSRQIGDGLRFPGIDGDGRRWPVTGGRCLVGWRRGQEEILGFCV